MLSGVRLTVESLKTSAKFLFDSWTIEIPEPGFLNVVGSVADQETPPSRDVARAVLGRLRMNVNSDPSFRCASVG